ncbi:hypothetical protein [Pseudomonas sp. S1(2024)]|uniref:hypothetical protein n=1 Tax=Pseudomonas sp. S1(2024) TaxID=3390191 RepID=UPI00397DB822
MQPRQTTRTAAIARLCKAIERAFERGESVMLTTHEYTYRKKGEELESEHAVYEALATGIYQKAPVTHGREVVDHTFIYYGSRDEIAGIVGRDCKDLTYQELEEMSVGLNAGAVLRSLAPDRSHLKRDEQELGL